MGESEADTPRQRIRLTYAKGENIKFISHQDESRMWERTLRRAGLPLLYKQGFNPQPHIQIAAPLGVGITGSREPIDILFSPPVALDEIRRRITAALPPGATISGVEEVPLKDPSLQGLLLGADYTIIIYAGPEELSGAELEAAIRRVLAARAIWRERERKGHKYTYNLRPLIFELQYDGYDAAEEQHRIRLRVQQRPGATGRPDEVVDALGFNRFARTLRRDRLYFAHLPEDAATFARYPEVTQEEISAPDAKRPPKRRRRQKPKPAAPAARTVNERAGDEFA